MGRKLQIKRGVKAALPPLDVAELAMTTDEKTLYYGTGAENIPVARAAHRHTAEEVGAAPSSHVGDASHVTSTEKQGWNSKAAGNHTHTAAQVGAAGKSTKLSATITTGWSGSAAPYTQSIYVTGVTANNMVEILLPPTATATQVSEFQGLNLQDGGQTAGKITLRAFGDKNTASIPVTVIVRGDL